MNNNHLIGKQVWIQAAPCVARNIVNATGTVQSITGSGRALVIFHEDDEIRRRLNTRGVYIIASALTMVNPFLKHPHRWGFFFELFRAPICMVEKSTRYAFRIRFST